jgi:hypothetical protein
MTDSYTNANDMAMQAFIDQLDATQRDHGEWCKRIHDSYIRPGFSPDHAFTLMLRRIDQIEDFYATD